MESLPGFRRFVALDEQDAPELFQRMTARDLPVDAERYGIVSRLVARPGAGVEDLAVRTVCKLCDENRLRGDELGAIVLSSRIVEVQRAAETIGHRLGLTCEAYGIERACSGFPAATALGVQVCQRLARPVAVITAEILSRNINWEPASGTLADHQRARGQAAKLFADGAAAALIVPAGGHEILDAWSGEVPDEDQLIQKIDVEEAMDPWGRILPGATTCMNMPGRRGFWLLKRAPKIMLESLSRSLERARQTGRRPEANLAHVVPHQANGLITAALAELLAARFGAATVKVWDCIAHSGNTVSASIPTAMAQVQDQIPPGVLVGMPSVGAGGPGYRPDVLSTGCVLAAID